MPCMTQHIWLARHGERVDSIDNTWALTARRPHDPGLSSSGFQQARELAGRLKKEKISHLFASPFLRTIQTAHVIAETLDLTIKVERGFCEWLNPAWFAVAPTFEPIADLSSRFPRIEQTYSSRLLSKYPEPTTRESTARFDRAVRMIIPDHPGSILIVGHGATVMSVARSLDPNTQKLSCPFCALTRLSNENGSWRVKLADDTSFLTNGPQGACF